MLNIHLVRNANLYAPTAGIVDLLIAGGRVVTCKRIQHVNGIMRVRSIIGLFFTWDKIAVAGRIREATRFSHSTEDRHTASRGDGLVRFSGCF